MCQWRSWNPECLWTVRHFVRYLLSHWRWSYPAEKLNVPVKYTNVLHNSYRVQSCPNIFFLSVLASNNWQYQFTHLCHDANMTSVWEASLLSIIIWWADKAFNARNGAYLLSRHDIYYRKMFGPCKQRHRQIGKTLDIFIQVHVIEEVTSGNEWLWLKISIW